MKFLYHGGDSFANQSSHTLIILSNFHLQLPSQHQIIPIYVGVKKNLINFENLYSH
jgi:hypothetical protein